jgi:hypothetical protein
MRRQEMLLSIIDHIDRKFQHLDDKLDTKFTEIDTRVKCVEVEVAEAKAKSRLIGKIATIAGGVISLVVSIAVSNWETIVATILKV